MSVLLATLAFAILAPGKAPLSDGRVVECVQISRSFDGNIVSWRPDGTKIPPATAVPFELNKHAPRVALLFRVPLKRTSLEPHAGAQTASTSPKQFGLTMFGSDILIDGKKVPGWVYFVVGFDDPGTVATVDMECFVTDGPHLEAIRFAPNENPDRHVKDFPRLAIEDRGDQTVISWGAPRVTPSFSASKVVADLKEPVNGQSSMEGSLPGGGKAWMEGYFFATPLANIKQFHVYRRETLKTVIKGLPMNPGK